MVYINLIGIGAVWRKLYVDMYLYDSDPMKRLTFRIIRLASMLKSKQRVLKTVIHILLDRVKLLIPVQFVDTTEEQRRQRAEPVPLSPAFRPPSKSPK